MYIDKLIKKEVITLLISVSLLVIIFIGVTYAKFLSVDNGQDTVINMGDLNISFCKDTTCDTTYTNIGQVIGTKVENGTTVPAGIYPTPVNNSKSYSTETPYIFKVENTGSLDSTVKIKLKEAASFTPSGDYSDYARLTSKYASHLKVAIKKRILYEDTGYQLGDLNMDGFFNLDDINILRDYLRGIIEKLTPEQEKLADVNFDGKISTMDLLIMREWDAGYRKDIYSNKVYTYTDLEDGVIFKDDIIKSGESAIYFLWLYLDETTPNDAQNTFFVGNIDVDGEYIPKVNPVSFATDSWETIVTAVKENNISKYNVGDTKEVNLGTTYGTHTLRIANTSTPSECNTTGFSQTACGFVLEFADIIAEHKMNDTGTNVGGWPASSVYTFVNNDIYNAIPDEIKNAIIDTTAVSGHGNTSGEENFTSIDKLYLLSPKEIYTNFSSSWDSAKDSTRQLDYYKNLGITTDNYSGAIKKNGTSATNWWLRAATTIYNISFNSVGINGGYNGDTYAGSSYGVAPAFRLG
ncbi:MAG: dockerin type I repeat-containing protein [Clostridium sp.]|nr:dockerin type I repeat-containing protein [Clostridium sp.]